MGNWKNKKVDGVTSYGVSFVGRSNDVLVRGDTREENFSIDISENGVVDTFSVRTVHLDDLIATLSALNDAIDSDEAPTPAITNSKDSSTDATLSTQ